MTNEKMQKEHAQMVMSIKNNPGKYVLLLGAGVSISAGVPGAVQDSDDNPSIVSRIKKEVYGRFNRAKPLIDVEIEKWFKELGWLQNPKTLYSDALDLIGNTERERNEYLRKFFEGKRPSEGHRYIAEMVKRGLFLTIFTPNFDTLCEKAIRDTNIEPLVVAHNETVASILILDNTPKVIKLHGDYLFSNIKNMPDELNLEQNMRDKFELYLKECGLIVVGYAGNDDSIMSILEKAVTTKGYLPYGLRWILKDESEPSKKVKNLIKIGNKKAYLITCKDSDYFFKYLRQNLLSEEIPPYETAYLAAFDSYINRLLSDIEKEVWHARYTPLKMMPIILREYGVDRSQSRKYEILDAVENYDKLIILGEPGAGKTTSLKMLAEEHAKKRDLFPLFIKLEYYAGNLMELIKDTIVDVDVNIIEKKLTEGNCLILLDSLNEVGDDYKKVVKEIRHLISRKEFQNNKFVITCRTHNYNKDFGNEFMTMEIQPLENYIIFNLLNDEFGRDNAKMFYQQMDEKMKGLCTNPLMLTLMIYELERRKSPSKNRAELFDQFIDSFLCEWEKRKGAKIAVTVKKNLLSALAFEMGVVTTIPFDKAQDIMSIKLQRLKEKSKAPMDYNIIHITHELLTNGLLKKTERRVSFFHQAVQEYFIALNVSQENIIIDKYLADKGWSETLVFLSGFQSDSTDLISKLKNIDPLLAARCVEYSIFVNPETVNDLIRLLINDFKYGPTKVGAKRGLSSLIVTISDRASKPLDYFFKEAYSISGESYAYSALALLYMDINRYEDAIKAGEKAVNLNPKDGYALFRLGIAYGERDLSQAMKYYRKAYKLDPKNKYVCYNLASALWDERKYNEAEKYTREALEIDPAYSLAHNLLGDILQEKCEIEKAIEEYKKAIKFNPYADSHFNLGNIYYSQKKFKDAIKHYAEAVKINPENAKFYKKIAETLEKIEEFDEANKYWENYLNLEPWTYDAELTMERIDNNKIKKE